MKEGTESKLKFKKLKRRLGLPEWQAVGLLESLWKLTRTSAAEGDIGRYSNEDIAAGIEYEGDADELIETLVATGWLDEDDEFRLICHDWSEHVPTYIKGNFAKHGRTFADVAAKQRANQSAKEPAISNVLPSQSNPNQVNIDRSIATEPIDISGKEGDVRELASSIAREFDGGRKLKPDDRETAYKAAVMEHCVPALRGQVVNLRVRVSQKLRGREPPSNPWAYFKSGLIKTCEENAVDFRSVWESIEVPKRPSPKKETEVAT